MANAKTLAALTAKRGAGDDNPAPTDGKDLDSTQIQEEILHPAPIIATVGGTEIVLHALSFKEVRKLRALMTLIFAEASGVGPVMPRVTGTLGLNDRLRNEFIRIVARATFATDANEQQLINIGQVMNEIDDKADFSELATLLTVMGAKNQFAGSAAAPK